jgi:hypothetical protein
MVGISWWLVGDGSRLKAERVKVQGNAPTGLTDQAEIFLPGNPSRFKVVVNDRDAQHLLGGNFFIRGNYHRAENTPL